MTNHRISAVVTHANIPFDEKKRLLAAISDADSSRQTITRIHDWAALLHPVERAIAAVASSAYRWRDDPVREPVYSAYLLTLRRTKQRIKSAKALNLEQRSIPEVAAAQKNPVPLDGLVWHAWVPVKVRAALLREFDELYNMRLTTTGKRIIPFSTHIERCTTDARWLALETRMLKMRAQYVDNAQMRPEVEWLDMALEMLRARRATDRAVIQWNHLLPKAEQEKRNAWIRATGKGDMTPPTIAARNDMVKLNEDAREAARAKHAEYQKKHRAKLNAQAPVEMPISAADALDDPDIEAERERKRAAFAAKAVRNNPIPVPTAPARTNADGQGDWLEE